MKVTHNVFEKTIGEKWAIHIHYLNNGFFVLPSLLIEHEGPYRRSMRIFVAWLKLGTNIYYDNKEQYYSFLKCIENEGCNECRKERFGYKRKKKEDYA